MANGGFKAFAYEVTGLGSGAALEDKMARCKEVLAALGDGLVGLDQGWSYDAGKTASGEAAILSGTDGNPQSYSLYFRHTSGAKMMLTYNVYGAGFDYTAYTRNYSYQGWDGRFAGGLAVTVAPATSGEFDPYATDPVPADVLRLHGFTASTNSPNRAASFLYNGETTDTFKYFLIVRGTQVIIMGKRKTDTKAFFLVVAGDVADCAHATDTHDFSRFATLSAQNAQSETELDSRTYSSNAFGSTSRYEAQFYSCSGAIKCGYDGLASAASVQTGLKCTGSAANSVRWFPIMLFADGATDGSGVMENDGFKGYVNHEVCCITRNDVLSMGQLLDGGNFIYLAGGLIIGWDPSNDVTMF